MRTIPLTRGYVTLVDDEDYETLARHSWTAFGKPHEAKYAARSMRTDGKKHTAMMHRLLLDAPPGMFVDHINGDTLDNRRANLRLATKSQNGCNRGAQRNSKTGIKGVTRAGSKWRAEIMIDRRTIYLGVFHTPEEARAAYRAAAVEYHGQFAKTG